MNSPCEGGVGDPHPQDTLVTTVQVQEESHRARVAAEEQVAQGVALSDQDTQWDCVRQASGDEDRVVQWEFQVFVLDAYTPRKGREPRIS